MVDFAKKLIDLPTISGEIKEAIEEHTSKAPEGDGPRTYLGASVIGHECKAALWFDFRWITPPEDLTGAKRRLFERGHLEEIRINRWLRETGWDVKESNPETGKQWRFMALDGHFAGSCDKQLSHPDKWPELGLMVGEDKTHSLKNFLELIKKGPEIAFPKHVAQMHIYGAYFQNYYALYFPICKNDDRIQPEVFEVNIKEARRLTVKAEEIISAKTRPHRCSESPTYFTCRYCKSHNACFNKQPAEKSCRACRFATTAPNSSWTCDHWGGTIPPEFMPVGCDAFKQVDY